MGLQPVWPHHPDLLRGLDLTRLQVQLRLSDLKQALAVREKKPLPADPPLLRASVLVPLIPSEGGLGMLFTRRTDSVLLHRGQISFPGGQQEPGDQNLLETALRESFEEIGLLPSQVEVLGELDDVYTAVSGYVISPFVGVLPRDLTGLRPAPDEVASLLVADLDQLRDPRVHRQENREFDGGTVTIHYYELGPDVVWGATGRIVHQFLEIFEVSSRSRS
jgi:8-oxo-dGTP pyrophosphatase MutT (NUDIX family)